MATRTSRRETAETAAGLPAASGSSERDAAPSPSDGNVEKAAEPPAVFLTPEELAKRWRWVVAPRTLRNWRTSRRGPAWKEIGARVLYAVADVERYERERDGQFLRRDPVKR